MKTWRLQNRGYDCNQRGPIVDCAAETWEEAVAMCLDVERVSFTQPINDVRGCSTFAAYIPSVTGGHTKIGVVYHVATLES